jgi:hypothetical protein
MSTLYSATERRRLGRKYRRAAVALWIVAAFLGLAVLGNLANNEAGLRDDIHPIAAVFAGAVGVGIVACVLVVLHRRSAEWKRAARIDTAPFLSGTITDLTHSRLGSYITIAIEGSTPWRFSTRDRNDTTSVPGDTVTIELYGTKGKVLGAYRNERTNHVRAVSTEIPTL